MALKVDFEVITPKKADELLDGNNKNRHLSQHTIDEYAQAMKAGEWQENGETIKITKEGELIDGQHRLHAILSSNTDQRMLIVRGLTYDHFQTIDIGRKRTQADTLELHGFSKNKLVLAAAINVCMDFDQRGEYRPKKNKRTPTMALNYIIRHKRLAKSVERFGSYNKKIKHMTSTSVICALHHQFSIVDKTLADEFVHNFIHADDLKKGDPVFTLREVLSLEGYSPHLERGRSFKRKVIARSVKAFNAFVRGEKLTSFGKYDPAAPIVIERL